VIGFIQFADLIGSLSSRTNDVQIKKNVELTIVEQNPKYPGTYLKKNFSIFFITLEVLLLDQQTKPFFTFSDHFEKKTSLILIGLFGKYYKVKMII
jgi:hypothetical protein